MQLHCENCAVLFSRKSRRPYKHIFCTQACFHAWMKKHKAYSGTFPKGHTPWIKSQKGIRLSIATEFKKGQTSRNWLPVGTVRIRKCKNNTQRAFVKIAEPNIWKLRAVLTWESEHGPLPRGLLIHHKDRNALNDNPSNLEATTRAEHIKEHQQDFLAKRTASLRASVRTEKEKACPQCHATWIGRGRRKALCSACAKTAEDASKSRYRATHSKKKGKGELKVQRFCEGEIWLIGQLIRSRLLSHRAISKMFRTGPTTIAYYAKKSTALTGRDVAYA